MPASNNCSLSNCYYRYALRLQAVAQQLLEEAPDRRLSGTSELAASLLKRVSEMRRDNPICWVTNGHCGRCRSSPTEDASDS